MPSDRPTCFAPCTTADKDAFVAAINVRFKDKCEDAVQYINGAIDRQIAKANGLLAYNAVLFAGLQVSQTSGPLTKAALLLSLLAAALLLPLFFVLWSHSSVYKDATQDFEATARMVFHRSHVISGCIVLSLVATVLSSVVIACK